MRVLQGGWSFAGVIKPIHGASVDVPVKVDVSIKIDWVLGTPPSGLGIVLADASPHQARVIVVSLVSVNPNFKERVRDLHMDMGFVKIGESWRICLRHREP